MILAKLFLIIKELVAAEFYGSLVIKFENGKVVNVQKTESLK